MALRPGEPSLGETSLVWDRQQLLSLQWNRLDGDFYLGIGL
jgi:hypothetical protein